MAAAGAGKFTATTLRAAIAAANARAGVGDQGLLGVREGADGTTTTYYAATLSGEVSAGVRGGDGRGDIVHATAGASGELEGVIEIDRDKDGIACEKS